MFLSTLIVVAISLISAICASVVAYRKQLPAANAVLLWFMPVWLYFASECMNRGGCSWIVWIEVARQLFTVIVYIAAASYGPKAIRKYESDYDPEFDI